MKILGRIIVFFFGLLVGLFLAYIMLGVISFQAPPVVYTMLGVFVFYIIGWLVSLIKGKQKLLFLSLTVFIGYIVYDYGVEFFMGGLSELTFVVLFIVLMYFGMFLIYKGKKKQLNH